MRSLERLIRNNVKSFKPCIHGAEVFAAAEISGFKPWEILDFSSNVNPLGPSSKALDAAKKAFDQIAAYPDSSCNELRRVISAQLSGISAGNVIVGNGSTELMYLFAEAFIDKGDTVLIPAPTFGEYESAVQKAGGTSKLIHLKKNFRIDLEVFEREMADAKIIFFCNPNNPTSMITSNDTIKGIVETALNRDILVFLDEDFLEFVEDEKSRSLIGDIGKYPNLFVLRSFTKIFGLTGLRVGYGIADEEIINALLCVKLPWNVNCLAQAAAVAAIQDQEHLKATRALIKKEKAWVQAELASIKSLKFSTPDANFFFIDIRKTGLTAAELKDEFLRQRILIRDCTSFKGLDEFYVRVAIKTHAENVQLIEALKRIMRAV